MATSTGDIEGTFIQAKGDVTFGKTLRDEQYELALNWEARGKPRMRGYDLSQRDLSGLGFAGADLQNINFTQADLRGANLHGADLEDAILSGAIYDQTTIWPDGFDPETSGGFLLMTMGTPFPDFPCP